MAGQKPEYRFDLLVFSSILGGLLFLIFLAFLNFYPVLGEHVIKWLDFKECEIMQFLITKNQAANRFARIEIIKRMDSSCSSFWGYKTLSEVLEYFGKSICDVELIYQGEWQDSVSGVRFKHSDSVIYYLYFRDSVNYRYFRQFVSFKQFVYQLLNSEVITLEAISPDGKAEICGLCFEFDFNCKYAHMHNFLDEEIYPFRYFKIKSVVTEKLYLLDTVDLSAKEKKKLGLTGTDFFLLKLAYWAFVDNPNKDYQTGYIVIGGEPDFRSVEEARDFWFCKKNNSAECLNL